MKAKFKLKLEWAPLWGCLVDTFSRSKETEMEAETKPAAWSEAVRTAMEKCPPRGPMRWSVSWNGMRMFSGKVQRGKEGPAARIREEEALYEKDRASMAYLQVTHMCRGQRFNRRDPEANSSPLILPMETAAAYMDFLSRCVGKDGSMLYPGERLQVRVVGGEPTICPLDYLLKLAGAIRGRGMDAEVETDGLDREAVMELVDAYDCVRIKVDGVEEIEYWMEHGGQADMVFLVDADERMTLRRFQEMRKAGETPSGSRIVEMTLLREKVEPFCKDPQIKAFMCGKEEWGNIRMESHFDMPLKSFAVYDGLSRILLPMDWGEERIFCPFLHPDGILNDTPAGGRPEDPSVSQLMWR